MAEIARRTRRSGRHRSHHTTEPKDAGSDADVNTTGETSTPPELDAIPAPFLKKTPRSWREVLHVHLSTAVTSPTALKRYLIIYCALIVGALVLVAGIHILVAAAGIQLWSALLVGAGGTAAPFFIALKRYRNRD